MERKITRLIIVTYRRLLLLKGLGGETRHVADDWREVGGAIEPEVRQAGGVGLGNALHTWRRRRDQRKGGQ